MGTIASVVTSLTEPNVTFERTSLRFARDYAHLSGRGQPQTALTACFPLCGVTLNSIR